jgi:cytochrome c-type biogenesis protein
VILSLATGAPALAVLAVAAGVVSFSSPCCLPLVPGYLSYLSALPVAELGNREARQVTLQAALLFVAGFTAVFTLLGFSASWLGSRLFMHRGGLLQIFGVGIIVLGLTTMGLLRIPVLNRERRLDLARLPQGRPWAFFIGVAFAAGWVPCIGPVLATILATAAATGTPAWGASLLVLYSLGLGLPFILLAVGFGRAQRSLAWLRRRGKLIETAGGAMLVAVGVLFLTGRWQTLFTPMQRWFARFGWPPI